MSLRTSDRRHWCGSPPVGWKQLGFTAKMFENPGDCARRKYPWGTTPACALVRNDRAFSNSPLKTGGLEEIRNTIEPSPSSRRWATVHRTVAWDGSNLPSQAKMKHTLPGALRFLVDLKRFELSTPTMRMWCAPNCATSPSHDPCYYSAGSWVCQASFWTCFSLAACRSKACIQSAA